MEVVRQSNLFSCRFEDDEKHIRVGKALQQVNNLNTRKFVLP
jgi:hypothetical protein